MNSIPKLPEGFEIDKPPVSSASTIPALPAGFKLDTPSVTTTRPATGTELPTSTKTSNFDEAVEGAKAAGEVALSLGLPLVTWPTSISAQLMTRAKGGTAEQARKVRDATMELGTYEPKTERAKNVLAALSPAMQTLTLGKSAFATSPKQVEEEVDQITKNPTLNALLKTGAVGLQQFAEPVRHAMTELGVGPGTTTYDLATSVAEVTGFAKAGRGIKNTRQGAKNFLREVKSEKAAAKAPLIELESQQQPSTARPAAKIEPVVSKPKVGEEAPRTILEEADKQFAKPEVREEINDYYRDLDKINEAKGFEEMEAYYKQLDEAPKPPEGFKIDVDPAMEKLKQEREVKTTTEKPLQDVEYREVSKDEVLPADSEVKMDTSTGKSYVKVAEKVPAVEEVKIEDTQKPKWFSLKDEDSPITLLEKQIKADYPGTDVNLSPYINTNHFRVNTLDIPKSARNKGAGTDIMNRFKAFADEHGLTFDLFASKTQNAREWFSKDPAHRGLTEKSTGVYEYTPKTKTGDVSKIDTSAGKKTTTKATTELGAEAEARAQAALKATTPKVGLRLKPTTAQRAKDILTGERGSLILGERKPFYSKLEEVINSKMRMSMPIEQLRKTALNNGVTVDEWNDVFKGVKGTITKKQALDELAVNGVKFEDVVLGKKGENLTSEERVKAADNPAQFEQYSEPGYVPGSYRELFVTAPEKNLVVKSLQREAKNYTAELTSDKEFWEIRNKEGEVYDLVPNEDQSAFDAIETALAVADRDNTLYNFKWQDGHGEYSGIQNPIVRVRFNERDVNGKRVLFVEEIQGPSPENQVKMPESLRSRIYDIGVKRVVSYAKENGFDEIAWTNGKTQADRYNLAKVINKVEAKPYANNTWDLKIVTKEGEPYFYQVATDNLEQYVGKDLTRRITENNGGTYSGLDLEVGGEGLKRLYDETIPGLMEKYSGGKKGSTDLVTDKASKFESDNQIISDMLSTIKTVNRTKLEIQSDLRTELNKYIDYLDEQEAFVALEEYKKAYQSVKDIREVGPKATEKVSSIPITEKTPSSFTLYSDPFMIQSGVKAVSETFKKGSESVRTVWNKAVENSRTAEGIDKGLKATGQDLREAVLNPEKVTAVHEVAKKDFEGLATAEEKKNIFLLRHLESFVEKMKGIKSGSKESELIGAALDGKIQRSELPERLHSAFDFLKQEFDFLINEYARLRAGSEEAYQKVLNLALSEKAQRIELKKLSPEDKLVYDTLRQAARDIRKGRKASQLNEDEKLIYDEIRQEISDFKGKNIKKSLTEGEGEAFDALRTKIKDYLPRLFDKEELISAFKEEITMNKEKLQKATVPGNITRLKNRINMLESSVKKLEGGEWVRYSQLPRDIQFRFFNKRKGKQGYSLDAIKAYETYIHGIARKMFDEPAIREIANTFSELPFELRDYVKKLTDHYMGYGGKKSFEWLSSNLASIEWMRTLGLNPRSAVVNYTQRFNTLADVGIKYSSMAEALMMRDLALKTKDKLTGNKRTYVTDEIFKRSGIAREIPSVMMEGTASTTLEQMRAVVGWMFNKVEFGNRKHAFLAGYLKAKADNPKLTEQELIKQGINTVHKTQFRYGKLGMPKMMWNPVGRVMFQFTSYPIKQAQFLYDLWKEDKSKFLKWVAYTQGFNYITQELFDTDLTNAVGVGINFGNALRMIEKLGEGKYKDAERYLAQTAQRGGGLLPSGDYPGVGPLPSALIKIAAASKEGQAIETLKKELMPVVGSRVRQTYLALKNAEGGEYPIYNDKGKLMYKLTGDQLLRRFFFSRTGQEYRRGEQFREEKALKEQYRDVSGEVTKRITDAILDDDDKAMSEALELAEKYDVEPDPTKIQKELYYRMLTEEERKVIGKDELYQIMREGETMEERYAE